MSDMNIHFTKTGRNKDKRTNEKGRATSKGQLERGGVKGGKERKID